jgi:hypothetical protein
MHALSEFLHRVYKWAILRETWCFSKGVGEESGIVVNNCRRFGRSRVLHLMDSTIRGDWPENGRRKLLRNNGFYLPVYRERYP